MKKAIKKGLFIFLLIFSSSLLFSQETRIELGDRYFNQHAYNKAIPLYETANKKTKEIYAKLGDCYYYTSQPERALTNYIEAFKSNNNSNFLNKYRLRYALCLHSAGKDSTNILNQYKAYYKDDKNIHNLSFRDDFEKEEEDSAENLDSINLENSDFGYVIFDDIIYFSSSREKENERKHNKKLYKWNEHPFLEIYTATIDNERNPNSIKVIHPDSSIVKFNKPAHEASVAFLSKDTMFFSGGKVKSNNKIDYNKRGVSNLKLQIAILKHNQWELDEASTEALNSLNLENYSVGNPAFNVDKTKLFFVSCAPYPNAMGQSDIYFVNMKDGKPYGEVKPVPGINTNGRESFPFVSSDGTLYFSSDGFYNYKLGLGLLDIYKVENIDEVINEFIETDGESDVLVSHLEAPFNSPKDDFAFFIEKRNDSVKIENYAYFSSNRNHPKAKGSDDIYRAEMIISKKEKLKTIKVVVTDSLTNEPLNDAVITLMDADDNVLQNVQVDRAGIYSFEVNPKLVYNLRGSRAKYYKNEIKTITFNEGEDISKARVNLKMKPIPCEVKVDPIEFKFRDSIIQENEGKKLKPLIKLLSENRELSIIIESHTDSVGSLIANMKLSQRRANQTKAYLISKNVHESQITNAVGQGENCPIYTTSYINSLATRAERKEAHKKNRRSIFILEDCEDYVSDCKKNEP